MGEIGAGIIQMETALCIGQTVGCMGGESRAIRPLGIQFRRAMNDLRMPLLRENCKIVS